MPDLTPQVGVAAALPRAVGVYHFQSRYWKKRFPAGITFEAGLGTAAVAAFIAGIAALTLLDLLSLRAPKAEGQGVDVYQGARDVRALYEILAGQDSGESKSADWLNALVPITALDNLLRGK